MAGIKKGAELRQKIIDTAWELQKVDFIIILRRKKIY